MFWSLKPALLQLYGTWSLTTFGNSQVFLRSLIWTLVPQSQAWASQAQGLLWPGGKGGNQESPGDI